MDLQGLHCYGPSNDKVYVVTVVQLGEDSYQCWGWYGRRAADRLQMQPKGNPGSLQSARREAQELYSEKLGRGYIDVDTPTYSKRVPANCRINLNQLQTKIVCTQVVGLAQPSGGTKKVSGNVVTYETTIVQNEVGASRSNRSIRL